MFARLYHRKTKETDLETLKNEFIELLQSERKDSNFCLEAKHIFLKLAETALPFCQDENEIRKLIIGCLTIVFVITDAEYGTRLSKHNASEISIAANDDEIKKIIDHYTTADESGIRLIVEFNPTANSIKTAFINIADYVFKSSLGCDDLEKTIHLKKHSLISSGKSDTTLFKAAL